MNYTCLCLPSRSWYSFTDPESTTTLSDQALFDNFWHTYTSVNFLSQAYFIIFTKLKAENQPWFKEYNAPLQQYMCVCAQPSNCFVATRDTTDFIIAPNLWLLNMSDFSPVDYRILAMLQEWVCQHPVWHVDKLRQRLKLIKRLIGGCLGCGHELWPDVDILNL